MHPTDTLQADWGKAVKAARETQDITQRELAGQVGIHPNHLSDIERGVKGAGDRLRYEIAKHLHLEVADLFAYPSTKQSEAAA